MSLSPIMTTVCGSCEIEVEPNSKAVQCRTCRRWLHYFCTTLPTYYIVLIAGSTISFTCEACIVAKFKDEFVRRHTEVVEACNAHKLLMAAPTRTVANNDSIITGITEEEVSTTASTDISVDAVDEPVAPVNDQQTGEPKSDEVEAQNAKTNHKVKSVCSFHLQGRCIHGRFGNRCKDSHPALCRKYILKGEPGCNLGKQCKYTHPHLCVKSLKDNTCTRRKCFLYHVTGSSRPNLPRKKDDTPPSMKRDDTPNPSVQETTAKPVTGSEPHPRQPQINQANLSPQLQQSHADMNASFLDQMKEIRSQIQGILQMQRQLMQCVFPQMLSMSQPPVKMTWPQHQQMPNMPFQYAPPHPQW